MSDDIRKPRGLDFLTGISDRPKPRFDASTTAASLQAAAEAGFSKTEPLVVPTVAAPAVIKQPEIKKFDGRSLRYRGKTEQVNLKMTPDEKGQLVEAAKLAMEKDPTLQSLGDFVLQLLKQHQSTH